MPHLSISIEALLAAHPKIDLADAIVRFESRVDRSGGPDACHLWTGQKGVTKDRGKFYLGDRCNIGAHKFAYWLATGNDVHGLDAMVLHSRECGHSGLCCNAAHLRQGTHKENMHDRHETGGYENMAHSITHKLTREQVIEIRAKWDAGARQVDLAQEYGVVQSSISLVCRGIVWPGIPGACAAKWKRNTKKSV